MPATIPCPALGVYCYSVGYGVLECNGGGGFLDKTVSGPWVPGEPVVIDALHVLAGGGTVTVTEPMLYQLLPELKRLMLVPVKVVPIGGGKYSVHVKPLTTLVRVNGVAETVSADEVEQVFDEAWSSCRLVDVVAVSGPEELAHILSRVDDGFIIVRPRGPGAVAYLAVEKGKVLAAASFGETVERGARAVLEALYSALTAATVTVFRCGGGRVQKTPREGD